MNRSAYDISIRETLQSRGRGVIVAIVLIVASLLITIYYRPPKTPGLNSDVTFYSDDDGQTYFKDSIYKLAPFDHNGKTANIAVVCTDGKQNFVGFLERYTPDTRKRLQEVYDANPTERYKTLDLMASPVVSLEGMEVKLPGKNNSWISRSQMRSPQVQSPGGDEYEIVRP